MTDRSFRKFKTDGESFLNAIRDVINRGADPFGAVPGRSVFFVGEGTLRRGGDVLRIYRGNGITIAVKPNGEFVTLLKSGEGLDLAIQFVK